MSHQIACKKLQLHHIPCLSRLFILLEVSDLICHGCLTSRVDLQSIIRAVLH